MRFFRWLLIFFVIISVSFTLYLETRRGQKYIKTAVEEALTSRFSYNIRIGKIHCLFPFYLELENVSAETKELNPVLFLSTLTMCPLPLPLSPTSFCIPYLSINSFSIHAHPLVQQALSQRQSSLSFYIPYLRLYNGEARDPHIPTPYAFSFKGSTKRDAEGLQLKGSLYDQTSALPIHMVKGEILLSKGKVQGDVVCSFKQESLLSSFQKLEVTFEPTKGSVPELLGSWRLKGSSDIPISGKDALSADLMGTFHCDLTKRAWGVTCDNYSVSLHQNTLCQGSWEMGGTLRPDYSSRVSIKAFILKTQGVALQLEGKLNSHLQEDGFHLSSFIEGTIASPKANMSFTARGLGFLSPVKRSLSFVIGSPFLLCEGTWEKERTEEKGTLSLEGTRLTQLFLQAPCQALSCAIAYNSTLSTPYQVTVGLEDFQYQGKRAHTIEFKSKSRSLLPLDTTACLHIENAHYQKTKIEKADVDITLGNANNQAIIHVKGQHDATPMVLDTTLEVKKRGFLFLCQSSYLSASLGKLTLSQTDPTTLIIDENGTPHDIHATWTFGNEGKLLLSKEKQHFVAHYMKCPISLLSLLVFDKEIQGSITGKTTVYSTSSSPQIVSDTAFELAVPIQVPKPLLHTIQGHVFVHSQKTGMETQWYLKDTTSLQKLSGDLTLPVHMTRSYPFFESNREGALKGKLFGSMDIQALLLPFTDEDLAFSGNLALDVAVQGSINAPQLTGTTSLREGAFLIPKLDALLSNIEMKGIFHDSALTFTSLKGTAGHEGLLRGDGTLEMKEKGLLWHLGLDIENATFAHTSSVTAAATGHVSLDGKNDALHIASKAKLTSCNIDLTKGKNSSYPAVQVTYSTSPSRHRKEEINPPSSLTFDIQLDSDHTLFIKGRSFESTWSGKALLKGPSNRLHMTSDIRAESGFLLFGGRKLNLERGKIDLNGTSFKDSRVDIVTIAPLSQITSRIFIGGSLDGITITLRSSPIRSEREILSLLLFNKEITNISPFQSLQLATTALSLERKTPGSFFFDTFKSSLGIDTIDISSATLDPNEVTLSVGKYISDGVTVSLSKDISSEANRIGLEVDLTDEVKASAAVGDDSEAVLSLTWKKEF